MVFDLFKYEIARRNMLIFCEHFKINDVMTKDDFFDLQKFVLEDVKKIMGEVEDNKEGRTME